jgi:hypothetical protein
MTNMFEATEINVDEVRTKYGNDPEKAWEALAHSQRHISKLESENAEKEQKLASAKTLEEVMNTIKNQSTVPPRSSVSTDTNMPSVLDENTLKAKVEEVFNQKTMQQRYEDNRRLVEQAMLSKYQTPDKANEQVRLKAASLDMTVEELQKLSVERPKAFLQFFELSENTIPLNTGPSRSSVNVQARQATRPAVNKMDEYTSLLKTDRNKYYSQEVQTKIMQEALKDPSAYGINVN